jgi:3-methyladenine DNA glycosylase AlkC
MPTPLKYKYDPTFFEGLCNVLQETIPGFDERQFIYRVFDKTWPDLELKERVRKITLVLHQFMPQDFSLAANLIVCISRSLLDRKQNFPFGNIFLPDYVAVFGLSEFKASMAAMVEVTKLVSAEFAIRPFLLRYPQETMAQMLDWSCSECASVRRLASEGCRPRLPWATALPAFKNDPAPVLRILENLKADPADTVRRSVANNLNDIAKDNPELVLRTASGWSKQDPATRWIVQHGCRTLLRKGNVEALRMHGFNAGNRCDIRNVTRSEHIKIGQDFTFHFEFRNKESATHRYRLAYAIDYLTATGKKSRRIFRIGEYDVTPAIPLQISRKKSFRDLATRRHYPGRHRLGILANGKEVFTVDFSVL